MKRFIIDANKAVINRPTPEQKVRPALPYPACPACLPALAGAGGGGWACPSHAWLEALMGKYKCARSLPALRPATPLRCCLCPAGGGL